MSKELQSKKELFTDIKSLIDSAKQKVATEVNSTMSALYWEIGNRLTKIKKVCKYQVLLGMWINGNTNTLHVRGKIFTTLLEDRLY